MSAHGELLAAILSPFTEVSSAPGTDAEGVSAELATRTPIGG